MEWFVLCTGKELKFKAGICTCNALYFWGCWEHQRTEHKGDWQVHEGAWCIFAEGKKIPFDPKEVTEGGAGKADLHNMHSWTIRNFLSRNGHPKASLFYRRKNYLMEEKGYALNSSGKGSYSQPTAWSIYARVDYAQAALLFMMTALPLPANS